MTDTSSKVAALVADQHRRMTPAERMQIASDMFETARAIVLSSLPPPDLSRAERRLALARRLYGNELPEAALMAHAQWPEG